MVAWGTTLATLLVGVVLPLAGSAFAQTSSPEPGPTSSGPVPGPTVSVTPALPPPSAASITDTEYLSLKIDPNGIPQGDPELKDWIRVRGPDGAQILVQDPAVLSGVKALSGSPSPRLGKTLDWTVKVPGQQFQDLYYQGKVTSVGHGLYETASGPKELPVLLDIAYYTGSPGAETRVQAGEFAAARGAAKMVFTVRNNTRQMQELTYNDVQTKKDVTAVAPVWTPYVVKIGPILFPDTQFDRIQTDGVANRVGNGTEVTWTLNLAPPDYPQKQTAIAQFLVARPTIPAIRVAAQPQYPAPQASEVTSEGLQFQKGRRSFLFDVFDLLRSNLISLTGLFGLLDDAFSNLAIPLISPEKHNRERGSFDDPNQLWALWTLAKGMEQLNRATDVLDYSLQLARNGLKGEIGTLQQMRHLLGKSTDPSAVSPVALPACALALNCTVAQINAYIAGLGLATSDPQGLINQVIGGSIWQNIKDLETVLGCVDCANDPNPELPEAPISVTALNPVAGLVTSVIRLKMALFEQNLACLQKENHQNQCATFSGVTNNTELANLASDWRKFTTITFPFGQEEIADGLYQLKVNGIDQIQVALGGKDQPNSLIWALHVLTDGMESLSDSFHQLGSTWRYLADSLQNFGIFGVETAKNTLQLDINTIDIQSAQRAAAAGRIVNHPTSFMGSPPPSKKLPVDTQFVLVYTTQSEGAPTLTAFQSTGGKLATAIAFALLIVVILGFARFRWYLI